MVPIHHTLRDIQALGLFRVRGNWRGGRATVNIMVAKGPLKEDIEVPEVF